MVSSFSANLSQIVPILPDSPCSTQPALHSLGPRRVSDRLVIRAYPLFPTETSQFPLLLSQPPYLKPPLLSQLAYRLLSVLSPPPSILLQALDSIPFLRVFLSSFLLRHLPGHIPVRIIDLFFSWLPRFFALPIGSFPPASRGKSDSLLLHPFHPCVCPIAILKRRLSTACTTFAKSVSIV